MLTYLGFAVAAAIGCVAVVQRAELQRARQHWIDTQADLTALVQALDARDETAVARLSGRHHARDKFVRIPEL